MVRPDLFLSRFVNFGSARSASDEISGFLFPTLMRNAQGNVFRFVYCNNSPHNFLTKFRLRPKKRRKRAEKESVLTEVSVLGAVVHGLLKRLDLHLGQLQHLGRLRVVGAERAGAGVVHAHRQHLQGGEEESGLVEERDTV